MTGVAPRVQDALDRVLRSQRFRNTPSSRRLLTYLAGQTASGEAAQLKEYTVGVDAFGKPPNYDPRQDSTVRIQMGRLRKKLEEYYESEGRDDAWLLTIPRGGFGLECVERPAGGVASLPAELGPEAVPAPPWRAVAIAFAALFLIAAVCAFFFYRRPAAPSTASAWTPELAELWRPLLETTRPLVIAIGNPLFLQFENKVLYRDPGIDKWDDLVRSPETQAVRQALGKAEGRPAYYYAAIGEVNAAFLLGLRLGPQQPSISLVRSSQLAWQQMAGANVLYLGPPRFFRDRLGSLPVSLEITEAPGAFKNLNPRPGEQEQYAYRDPVAYFSEDGEAYVLVTRAAGPSGHSGILTFASNSTFARAGAVDALTSPEFTKSVVAKLRGASAAVPRYFQLLLRVKYKGGVPTETSYVLHRQLAGR
jgi:hypothetical protein